MYTSSQFESKEAARSHVERLQNQPLLIFWHGNCSNGWQKYMSLTDVMTCIENVQNMEVTSLCNSQSDLQCLEWITSAPTAVAICLNTIGHNVACFTCLLADSLMGPLVSGCIVCGSANPLAKTVFCNFWKLGHRWPSCPRSSRGWICKGSTWLLAASSDSILGEVCIIGFLKVCSFLWCKSYNNWNCK